MPIVRIWGFDTSQKRHYETDRFCGEAFTKPSEEWVSVALLRFAQLLQKIAQFFSRDNPISCAILRNFSASAGGDDGDDDVIAGAS